MPLSVLFFTCIWWELCSLFSLFQLYFLLLTTIIAVFSRILFIHSFPINYFSKSCCAVLSHFNHVQLFATLWTIALQAPLSKKFSKQEHWSRLPYPPPGDLPDPGIEPVPLMSPAMAGRFFTTRATWDGMLIIIEYISYLWRLLLIFLVVLIFLMNVLVSFWILKYLYSRHKLSLDMVENYFNGLLCFVCYILFLGMFDSDWPLVTVFNHFVSWFCRCYANCI